MRIGIFGVMGALLWLPGAALAQDSESAFQSVIDALTAGRQMVLDETPEGDGTDRAEGMRYLLRQIEMNLQGLTDDHDTAHPSVTRCPSRICKLGFDNPDNGFVGIGPIDDQHTYRITGHRGTVDLITFQVFDGFLGGGTAMTSDDLIIEPDGRFEIILSPDPQPGNWMPTSPLSERFIIRIYFVDWENEREPSFQIEVLEEDGSNPIPSLTPEAVDAGLSRLAGVTLSLIPDVFNTLRDSWLLNDLPVPVVGGFGFAGAGFPGNHTAPGRYQVEPDEALLIEVENTASRYHDIQLGNHWMESLEYSTHQVSLNRHQAHLDDDNVYRYVLAHSDPGVPNWLDIEGRPEGTLFMRFLLPDENDLPTKPNVQIVPLANVRNFLPGNHPLVTPADRAERLYNHRQAYNRRTNPAGLNYELVTDADGDGEVDANDRCPGSPVASGVDDSGCTLVQFCSAISTTDGAGRRACIRADWRNDEPRRPRDCEVDRQGRGREDDICVPR